MATVRRFDLLAPDRSKARRDEVTGFLHTTVRGTRSGVLAYRQPDGTVSYELRHPDDVFEPASLETLKRIVVTRGHPRKQDGSPLDVTLDNVRTLQVGHGGDSVRRVTIDGEEHPEFEATITDAAVIESVTNARGGKRRDQVSMGYLVDVVDEAGTYNGQPYTRRHKNIRYNHLAVDIEAGRCGPSVAMVLDEADALLVDDEADTPDERVAVHAKNPKQRTRVVKFSIDGIEVEFADTGLASIVKSALESRDKELALRTADAKAKADELERVQAKLDQAEAGVAVFTKIEEAPDIKTAALDVIRVLDAASRLVELSDARRDELLESQGEGDLPSRIRRAVVAQALPAEAKALQAKSDAYIEARFDALLAEAERAGENHRRVAATVATASRGDSRADDRDPDLTPLLDAYDPLEIMGRLDESEARFIVRR